ncbi:hypothetical protein H3V13_00695 [Bartonella sp. M0280]|uniref:hypothetical protein n=1 Tax=Bartonella apihabitans TaxID=2750929 RepID=UPI0018DB8EAB|nr:hypothetical protein [Bartonella apihabitans]MBI0166479.1 hypothetical protein [Bartonella apihabitans]
MARFIYKGPFQARTIKDGSKTVFDGNLVHGKAVELPENHDEIKAMIAGGLLEAIAAPAHTPTEPKKKETK